jgi:hypothetical protein
MTDQQFTAVLLHLRLLIALLGLHGWHHGGICLGVPVTTDESSVTIGDFHGSRFSREGKDHSEFHQA